MKATPLLPRIGLHHRALTVELDDGLAWFWIGATPTTTD
jgi:hypothetical protein